MTKTLQIPSHLRRSPVRRVDFGTPPHRELATVFELEMAKVHRVLVEELSRELDAEFSKGAGR